MVLNPASTSTEGLQNGLLLMQVVWVSVGASAWLSTKSDQIYVDMALRSADERYDGKRPRLRVRLIPSPRSPLPHYKDNQHPISIGPQSLAGQAGLSVQ